MVFPNDAFDPTQLPSANGSLVVRESLKPEPAAWHLKFLVPGDPCISPLTVCFSVKQNHRRLPGRQANPRNAA